MKGKASGFTAYTATGAIKIAQQSSSVSIPVFGPPGADGLDSSDDFILPPGNLIGPAPSVYTFTTTGNIDNLDFQNAPYIRANNASPATIRGLKAGCDGQRVTIISIGAGEVDLAHQNAGSSAGDRLINFVTGGITPLAAGVGTATYQYDVTTARWRLISHCQGDFITVPYLAGNFTTEGAGTWTVESGDQATYSYYLDGRGLYLQIGIVTSTVVQSGGSPTQLRITLPNGYTSNGAPTVIYRALDNGVNVVSNFDFPNATYIRCWANIAGTQWANSTNLTYVLGEGFCSVI